MKTVLAIAVVIGLVCTSRAQPASDPLLAVTLTSPGNGASFGEPASVPFAATTTVSPGHNVAMVQYFWSGILVGSATTAPYQATWDNVGQGTFSLLAVVTDESGGTNVSASVTITVNPHVGPVTNPLPNPGSLTAYRGRIGQVFYFTVTGSLAGGIYGTDIYTDDSTLSVAAVHAGVLTNGQTGIIKVTILPGQASYLSTTRHGVTSAGYGSWVGSYSVDVPTPTTVPPVIVLQPVGGVSSTGSSRTLNTVVQGGLPQYYHWTLDGAVIPGASDTTLILSNLNLGQSGGYALVATNAAGSITSQVAQVTVVPNTPPSISLVLATNNPILSEPADVPLLATASDNNGVVAKVDFYWEDYLIETISSPPFQFTWPNVGQGSYSLRAVATDDSGTTNVSNTINFTVGPHEGPVPDGLPNPGSLVSYRGKAGQVYYFAVTAALGGALWGNEVYTDDSALATVAVHAGVLNEGQTGVVKVRLLQGQVNYASTTRNGVTSNPYGTWPASYAVDAPVPTTVLPVITNQPTGRVASSGSSFTLMVRADGGLPLRYQWRFNGNNIADALDRDLPLRNLTASQSGSYSVMVTNAAGKVTSDTADLTVVPNVPPTVALTSPTPGANFSEPATIPMAADASDRNGSVEKVDFYWGNYLLGTAYSSPWEFNWTNVGQGTFSVHAVATDDSGTTSSSSNVLVTVGPRAGSVTNPPVAPPNMTGYRGQYAQVYYFTITAVTGSTIWGTDVYTDDSYLPTAVVHAGVLTNGQTGVIRVSVLPGQSSYLGSLRHGVASSDYGNWVGSYSISAVADGIIVPTVVLTSPTDGALLVTGTPITLNANASEAGGVITRVDFLDGGTVLGSDANAPFSFLWMNASPGNHLLGARAYDDQGASAFSTFAQVYVGEVNPLSSPVITQQPVNITVPEGGSAQLTLVASNAMTYQWWKDGGALGGASQSVLDFPAAALTDAGDYFAVVANSFGSVTSQVVHVTVTSSGGPPPPALAIKILSQTKVLLCWPASSTGFVLQHTPTVAVPSSWNTLVGTASVVDQTFVMTDAPGFGPVFYRLKKAASGP